MPEIVSQKSGPISSGSSAPSPEPSVSSTETEHEAPSLFEDDDSAGGESQGEHSDRQDSGTGEDKPQSAAQKRKRESQYARAKRQRAAFQAERATFEQQRAEWQRQQQEAAEKAKGPKFDLNELKQFRDQWKAEENWDLVEKADAKIAELEAEVSQKNQQLSKTQVWHQAERELSSQDPEFLKQGTRLDTRIRAIMGSPDGDIYRGHERGIVAAYHRAKMEILQEDHTALQKKFHELEQEYSRVTGLTSLSGGTPGRMGNGQKDFSSLTTAEMRKRLQTGASRSTWI